SGKDPAHGTKIVEERELRSGTGPAPRNGAAARRSGGLRPCGARRRPTEATAAPRPLAAARRLQRNAGQGAPKNDQYAPLRRRSAHSKVSNARSTKKIQRSSIRSLKLACAYDRATGP